MGHSGEKIHIDVGVNGVNDMNSSNSSNNQKMDTSHNPDCSPVEDGTTLLCRVCHCVESDILGDAALSLLDIIPPSQKLPEINGDKSSDDKVKKQIDEKADIDAKMSDSERNDKFIELRSPGGETFVCSADVESGPYVQQDRLTELGCCCKNDLSVAHYACALKWFISHGNTICEICGTVSKNIRISDFKKVMASLKDYEALRERTTSGERTDIHVVSYAGVDPVAIAAIRRQRLSEISSWFNPQNTSLSNSQEHMEQMPSSMMENVIATESSAAKWAVEGTAIFVATGLLTLILAWLIAPRVGKKTAKNGFHILLGGICALTVVVFLRIVVLSRIKYGPARYWAILFVFWFLIFGVWASRTHHIRAS